MIYRPISDLKIDPKNPRLHTPRQIRQIARSIETFGYNVPVLIDRDKKVLAGTGQVLACQSLGLTQVPTISLAHLSDAQARAFMIADNRLTETSEWDEQLLAEQLKELSVLDLDFSLEATGFEMGEIDLRIEGLSEPEGADPADVAALAPAGPPVSRHGDVHQLGPHRLRCGSALDPDAYLTLMAGEQADMAITDPPYNERIDGHASGLGTIRHREFKMASGEMNEEQYRDFLATACSLLARHSVPGSLHSIFIDWRHLPELLSAGREVYTELKNVCVWVKDNAGMGSLYRSQHELVMIFKSGDGKHHNNIRLGQYGRNRTNVWHYPCANSFSRASDEGNLLAVHPTPKPVRLLADAILDCSPRGGIVLDAFLGSGSTLIAAERTGRRCRALELEPLYVDAAIRRWQSLTGESARHAVSGRLFSELEAEVEEGHGQRRE